jgi:hypothetical protein
MDMPPHPGLLISSSPGLLISSSPGRLISSSPGRLISSSSGLTRGSVTARATWHTSGAHADLDGPVKPGHDGERGRSVDENGRRVDENSRRVDENGRRVDENGRRVGERGRCVDQCGGRDDPRSDHGGWDAGHDGSDDRPDVSDVSSRVRPAPAWLLPLVAALAFLLLPALVRAADAPTLDQVRRADGAQVVPDHFLRRWDPVTVFFPADTGPAQAAPEDHPERFVSLTPEQPGAWRWLGPRVLQFRPAEPWTPLRRVTITAAGHGTTLVPLLPEPLRTAPDDQPEGTADLDTIALTFQDPVDPAALARLMTIELRPLPGIDATGGQTLTREDFDISPLERANRADSKPTWSCCTKSCPTSGW